MDKTNDAGSIIVSRGDGIACLKRRNSIPARGGIE